MKVTLFGTGYVGLVTGACLPEMGNHVLCLDLDERTVQLLKAGGVPIHEPGLEAIIGRNVAAHRLEFSTDDERAVLLMRSLYAPYVRARERLLVMDVASAEFSKYAANAMLATRISFMNELALLAEVVGADIESVRQGIGSDPRIGHQFL
jgi:UDP-glucose 6-dehydrogenase